MIPMKIIGNTIGTTIPKPNLMQTDPTKGDYVKGKNEFIEQLSNSGGSVSDEQIANAVEEYLTENPPVVQKITINGKGPDENGNFVVNTSTSTESDVVEF